MKFRNPWIDPPTSSRCAEAVQAYLLSHGWEYLGPADVPDMLMFDTPQPRGDKPNVLLPLKLDEGAPFSAGSNWSARSRCMRTDGRSMSSTTCCGSPSIRHRPTVLPCPADAKSVPE